MLFNVVYYIEVCIFWHDRMFFAAFGYYKGEVKYFQILALNLSGVSVS